MTPSPVSMCGVNSALCLPRRSEATRVASRPNTIPSASITNQPRSRQSARKLVAAIYRVSKEGEFARDFGLRNQIRRAALSVMANIAEGFSYRSDKEFAKFLLIAKASALEVQSHLYAALDQGYLTEI